jgi:hypothetical protein
MCHDPACLIQQYLILELNACEIVGSFNLSVLIQFAYPDYQ